MNRRVNVKLLAFVLGAAGLFAVGVHLLHGYQERRNAAALLEQADRAVADGQREQGAKYLRAYLGFVPDDTAVLARYGQLLDELASHPNAKLQAMEVLEQVLRRDGSRNDVRERIVAIAMHPQVRRFADAREHLEVLLRDAPATDGGVVERLGKCCAAEGDYAQAATWFAKAVEREPSRVDCYAALAELLRRRLEKSDRAAAVLDQMVAANPETVAAYLARARFRLDLQQTDAAAGDIARAAKLAPDDAGVLLAAGRLALNRREIAEARQHFERGLKHHPDNAQFYLALAEVAVQDRHADEAVGVLRRGLEALPGQIDLLWSAANLLLQQGQSPTEEMDRLVQAGIPPAQRDLLQARVLINQGQWLAAARLLEQCQPRLQAWPELSKQADLYLGQCQGRLGNLDQQYAAYRRAVSTDPLWEPACMGLAATQAARGEIDEALATYRRVQGRVPAVRLAMARLLIARRQRLPVEQRQWQDVEQLLDEAERAVPDAAEAPILRAELRMAQEKFAEAEELLNQARTERPNQPDAWIALAGLAARQGKYDAARALLDEATAKLGDRVALRSARAACWTMQGGATAAGEVARLADKLDGFSRDERHTLLNGLAGCLLRLGARDEAENLWTRVASETPGDLQTRIMLFDLALRAGRDDAAQRLLTEIKEIEGSEGVYWRYGRACCLIRQGKAGTPAALTEARQLLAQLALARPTWSRVAVAQGEVADALKDPATALKSYQKAIELGERQPDVVRRAVELLAQQRRYMEADELIQKLPGSEPVPGHLQRLAAALALQRKEPERALKLARAAVSAESRDYRDYLWLGQFLAGASVKEEAEATLRRAVELAPTAPEAWAALIMHLARVGQKDQAATAIADARAKLPPAAVAAALPPCYEALGQPDEARKLYTQSLALRPDDVPLRRALASFCLRHGPAAEAEHHLRKLVGWADRSADDANWARRTLAVVLAANGDYLRWREAMTLVGLREDKDPPPTSADNAEDQRTRAVVLAAQKNPQQRQRAIRLLEELRGKQSLSGEEIFLLAQLYDSTGKWATAREQYLQLVTAASLQPRHVAHYAHALLRHDDAAEAEIWLNKLEKLPGAAGAFAAVELKASLLAAKDDAAGAVDLLQQYADAAVRSFDTASARLSQVCGLLDQLDQKYADRKNSQLYTAAAEKALRQLADKQADRTLDLIAFLARHGRGTAALELCATAWQTCPPELTAAACVAVVRNAPTTPAEQKQVEDWLTAALTKHPQATAALRVCLADLRDAQGRYGDAEQLYRLAIAADAKNVVALNNLAYLLALRNNRPTEAMELLQRAVALAGPTPELVDTRALIHLKLGQTDKAVKDLEAAVAEAPLPPLCYHLAQAHHLARNAAAAREALLKAKNLGLQPDRLHALERPTYQQLHAELGAR